MGGSIWGGPPTRSEWEAQQGLFEHRNQIGNLINQGLAGLQTRPAPQLDTGPQDQFRQQQIAQVGNLAGIANGTQQGAGELAVQRQAQNALAAQQALARIRGAGGLGFRDAARNASAIGVNTAGMSQQAAMQDQQGANALLTQALQGGRGQDIGIAGQNAQLTQNQTQLNDAQYLGLLSQLTGLDVASLQARLQAQQIQNQNALGGPLLSAGGQVLGAAIMHSDERLKTDVAPAGDEIDVMLDALKPYRYRYKDEKHGQGERAGIMAQDLERSEAGRRLVYDAPDGKALDVNKTLSAALASAARLNERVRKLEARG